jgi:GNAT superfamily N-acetyltransferase
VEIRAAAPEDAAEVAELLIDLGYPASLPEVERRLAALDSESDCVLLAPGGLVALHRVPRLAEGTPFGRITALVVASGHRGKGVGRALLEAAEEVARGWGCEMIEVSSGRRPERQAAHAFYVATGFEDTSTRSVRYWRQIAREPTGG